MKERPILFSAPMVRAILDGTKTQTRRIVKPQPSERIKEFLPADPSGFWGFDGKEPIECIHGRHGEVGDRLYVREAFRLLDVFDGNSPCAVADLCLNAGYRMPWAPIHYEADGRRDNWQHVGTPPHDDGAPKAGKLRPGIRLPRWASRILIEIVSVRVERLNDISEADARAEGAPRVPSEQQACPAQAMEWYHRLWNQINGSGAWALNPWVWVVEFKRVKP